MSNNTQNINYKQKYLNYKQKYLNLKQFGGFNKEVYDKIISLKNIDNKYDHIKSKLQNLILSFGPLSTVRTGDLTGLEVNTVGEKIILEILSNSKIQTKFKKKFDKRSSLSFILCPLIWGTLKICQDNELLPEKYYKDKDNKEIFDYMKENITELSQLKYDGIKWCDYAMHILLRDNSDILSKLPDSIEAIETSHKKKIIDEIKAKISRCPAAGSKGPEAGAKGPEAALGNFGTFNYKELVKDISDNSEFHLMVDQFFMQTFETKKFEQILFDIDDLKKQILKLEKDENLIFVSNSDIKIPVFPVVYDKRWIMPLYLLKNSSFLDPEQFQKNELYSIVDVVPYPDSSGKGILNYPDFSLVIDSIKNEKFNKNTMVVYIQNVLGSGECLYRSLINGYYYSKTKENLGYNPKNSDKLVLKMKELFLNIIKYCVSDKKKETLFNCSEKFYRTFISLLLEIYSKHGFITFTEFEGLYMDPTFYGGPFECNLFSQLINYKVNYFNKFTNPLFFESFDERIESDKKNEDKVINVLYVGGHFMYIFSQ